MNRFKIVLSKRLKIRMRKILEIFYELGSGAEKRLTEMHGGDKTKIGQGEAANEQRELKMSELRILALRKGYLTNFGPQR